MEEATILIREGYRGDAGAIAAILHALNFFEFISNKPLEVVEQDMRQRLMLCESDESTTMLVAELPDLGVVGYLSVHWFPHLLFGMDGYISELFVHPAQSGKGIGSCLLQEVERLAKERNCPRLQLINYRHRESYQRGFYAKYGWEERQSAAFFVRNVANAH